ncbi:hypothetical protein B8W66_04585 [Mycobacterium decipiens]|uniref:Acyltransferase 3 domain-containing protein n=2 Tax=Mycobacterium decipiens TaxID=1430326 RepID=A0A1X2LYF1_9MYCO|nr:hypothetical protein B8W66_04585 [Mycobacterium decipiens]
MPSLSGLRAIAAGAVLAVHLFGLCPGVPSVFTTLGPLTFFFILSGFILTLAADPNDTAWLFWRRRLVRIFPNHLVTFAITIALMVSASVPIMVINTIPVLLLIQAWIPNFDALGGLVGINVPVWFLCCEVMFYLAFPWLIRLIKRIRGERLWWWVAGVVTVIIVVPFVALMLPAQPVTSWAPTIPLWQSWFAYGFPVVRLLEFVLGILMARIMMTGKWIRLGMAPAFLLVLTSMVIQSNLPGVFRVSAAPAALPIALAIAACASADMCGVRTPFSGRTMVWLGEISFAFYMVHWLVIEYGPLDAVHATGGVVTASLPMWLVRGLLTVVISFALAVALYLLVERPAVRRFSRPASRSERSVVVPGMVAEAIA